MYAVIKTGGKQYRVAADQKIQIEKLEGNPGDQIQFTDVLMVTNGGTVDIGAPFVTGATVVGEIASQDRGPHLIIFKKRRRKHYRRRNGHRQDLTSVTIREILLGGAKPSAKKAEAAPAAIAAAAPAASAPDTAAPLMAAPASGASDDISLIGGVGPKMEAGLRELGFNSIAAIAAMSDEDIARAEEHLKQKGRFAREEWIEQAKELMAGKPPRAKSDRERT